MPNLINRFRKGRTQLLLGLASIFALVLGLPWTAIITQSHAANPTITATVIVSATAAKPLLIPKAANGSAIPVPADLVVCVAEEVTFKAKGVPNGGFYWWNSYPLGTGSTPSFYWNLPASALSPSPTINSNAESYFTMRFAIPGIYRGNVTYRDPQGSYALGYVTVMVVDHTRVNFATNTYVPGNGSTGKPWSQTPGIYPAYTSNYDSDNDGLPDAWERTRFGNLAQNWSGDWDRDGVSNARELAVNFNPANADTDSDLLPDGWELANLGKFAVYSPSLSASLFRNQSSPADIIFSNDTDLAGNYTLNLTGNSGPAYSFSQLISGNLDQFNEKWTEISETGILLPTISNADDASEPVPISGFTFPFYGQSYGQVYVSSNGLLTFGTGSSSYSNSSLPGASLPANLIAALWDDLDTRTTGEIYYKQESDRLIIQYKNVSKLNGSGNYTFQVVLFPDGRIQLFYKTVTGDKNSCSIGTQDSTKAIGLQVLYDAPYLVDSMIIEIRPHVDFFTVSPMNGSMPAHSVQTLSGLFQSSTLAPSIYVANLTLTHNWVGSSPFQRSIRLEVKNAPSSIELISPQTGLAILEGNTVNPSATANDPDGIARVEFYDGPTKIGESLGSNNYHSNGYYEPGVGQLSLTARVVDIYGAYKNSDPVIVNVTADTDRDSISNNWELANGFNPNDPADASGDADLDGYTNLEEYKFGKNPRFVEDTDSDLMPDGWEYRNDLNIAVNDASEDPDHDGLNNLAEYRATTDPNNSDSDSDGFYDGLELQYAFLHPATWDNPNADHDLDGMPDLFEAIYGLKLNVNDASLDPDGDTLSNLEEFHLGSPPNDDDVDCDGLNDAEEQAEITDPWSWDTDGDGLADGWEIEFGLNPLQWQSSDMDPDGDGLKDSDEVRFGTGPFEADSDHDGVSDGDEVTNKTDPMDDEWGGIPPAVPTNLIETQNGNGTITFTWQDNSNDETVFRVYRHAANDTAQLLGEVPANTTTFNYTPPSNP